jgi:hypothetical protein
MKAEWLPLDVAVDDLGHRACDRDRCRQHHVAGDQVQRQEHDGGKEVGGEFGEYVLHRRVSPGDAFVIASFVPALADPSPYHLMDCFASLAMTIS